MANYVLAIDQGTTSTRAIIFDQKGSIVSTGQLEHEQILPRAGWVDWRLPVPAVCASLAAGRTGSTSPMSKTWPMPSCWRWRRAPP